MKDTDFMKGRFLTRQLIERGVEHPKLTKLKDVVELEIKNKKKAKIIVFTQFRTSATKIKKTLDDLGLNSKIFVGQAKKENTGLSQKEQKQIITEFSKSKFNCLISTSVGEEGLDIPQVDLVLFYEPVPSAIRTIQRRGRTGRLEKGRVIILMTKKTRDEGYRWSAHHKEKRMYRNLKSLKNKLFGNDNYENKNKELTSFLKKTDETDKNQIKIIVDHRERGSGITKKLVELGANVDLQSLDVGDYILSDDVTVEFKTKKDFVDSIIDGRLLSQIKDLVKSLKPLLIIQGDEDIYSQRNIHSNAIRGMLSAITISYRVPIIFTKNAEDTANTLYIIAKREQDPTSNEFQMHTAKPLSLKEQQEYVVAALPGVGASLAKLLLKKFGSIKKLFNAKEEKMQKVSLIGKKKSKKIKTLIDSEYKNS